MKFEYVLIPTWWFPKINGSPLAADRSTNPFRLRDEVLFWDAVVYTGWGPWVGLAALLGVGIWRRRMPGSVAGFMLLIGVGAFVLALPAWSTLRAILPGVYLRSPARLVYITEFALAFALAAATDALIARSQGWRIFRRVIACIVCEIGRAHV